MDSFKESAMNPVKEVPLGINTIGKLSPYKLKT